MKEDYLWDKTGEDAEIERLEAALKAFRYKESAPPELPARILTVAKESKRGFFQLRFAFAGLAAFASVAAVLALVWFQLAGNKVPPSQTIAERTPPKSDKKIANTVPEKAPEFTPVENPVDPLPLAKPKVVKTRQKFASKIRPNKAVQRELKIKDVPETLTAEEKYAYDQLMLALSITGSKLRIVKDKIQGIEEQNAALDRKR